MASSITAAVCSDLNPHLSTTGSPSAVASLSDFELKHKRFFSSTSQAYPVYKDPHGSGGLPVSSAHGQETSKFFMSSLLNLHHQQHQQHQHQQQQHLQNTGMVKSLFLCWSSS